MQSLRTWAAVLAVAVLAVLAIPSPASAGTNGQHVYFSCSGGLGQVTIQGHNQNGDPSTWSEDAHHAEGIGTYNSWWKDDITIEWYSYRDNSNHQGTARIPTFQPFSDWVNLSC